MHEINDTVHYVAGSQECLLEINLGIFLLKLCYI